MIIKNEDLRIVFISDYTFSENSFGYVNDNPIRGMRSILEVWVEKGENSYKMYARKWVTQPQITSDEEGRSSRYSNGRRCMWKIEGHWCMMSDAKMKERVYQDDKEMQGSFNKFAKEYIKNANQITYIPKDGGTKGYFKGRWFEKDVIDSKVMYRRNTIK